MKKWFFLSLVLLLSLPGQASARHGQPGRWHTSFEIGPDGDTISVVPIKPVFVFSKKADLRRYRKLVEAVKKVYPVAQAAKAQMVQMEAELLRLETKKEQKQYIKGIAAAIKKEYTPVLKHMTRTQGRVLLKLIDRKRNTRLTKSSGSSGAASSRDSGKAYRVSSDRISSRNTTAKGTTRCSNRSFSITKRGCCKPHPPAVHRQSPCFPSVCNLRSHRRHDRMPSPSHSTDENTHTGTISGPLRQNTNIFVFLFGIFIIFGFASNASIRQSADKLASAPGFFLIFNVVQAFRLSKIQIKFAFARSLFVSLTSS